MLTNQQKLELLNEMREQNEKHPKLAFLRRHSFGEAEAKQWLKGY